MLFGRRHSRQQQTRGHRYPRRTYFGRLFALQAVQPVKVYGTGRTLKSSTCPEFHCFRAQSRWHTEAGNAERHQATRERLASSQASGPIAAKRQPHKKKTRPGIRPIGFFKSRHSVREAAFKRDAVQSRVHQTSPTQHAIRRKLCAHSYCRLGAAFFNGLSDGAQQRPCTSQRPQQSPARQEW